MSETIMTTCPGCQKIFQLPENLLGSKGACDECGTKFIIEQKSNDEPNLSKTSLDERDSTKKMVHLKRKSESQTQEKNSPLPDAPSPAFVQFNAAAPQTASTPLPNPYLKKKKSAAMPMIASLLILGAAGGGYYWHTQQKNNPPAEENKTNPIANKKVKNNQASLPAVIHTPSPIAVSHNKTNRPPHWSSHRVKHDPIQELQAELKQKVHLNTSGSSFVEEAKQKLNDPNFQADLAAYTLLNKCGSYYFEQIKQRPEGAEFLHALFADTNWQEEIMASGPFRHPKITISYLYHIWKHGREDLFNPLYKKLATSVALEHAERQSRKGNVSDFHVVRRFQDYVNAHKELRLHADFDNLETWEMRFAIEMDGDSRHFKWHSDNYRYKTGTYTGTCWEAPYRLHNVFGDSIHRSEYYKSWEHAYNWPEMAVKVGGVCGTLSHFGASAARVSGIPAMAAGQPGHCAYIIRINNEWVVTYSVDWPTTPKNSFWGWSYTLLQLIEKAFEEPQRIIASQRAAWLGDVYLSRPKINPQECEVYTNNQRWRKLPNFDNHTPEKTVPVADFDYRKVTGKYDWLAVRYNGKVLIPETGMYQVRLKADDEATLRLQGQSSISGNYKERAERLLTLEKGELPFSLDFLEITGADYIQFEIKPVDIDERVLQSYAIGTEIAPLNYELWQHYKTHLLNADSSSEDRVKFARNAAKALNQHQEAAWHLLSNNLFENLSEEEKMEALLEQHQILQQKYVKNFVDYPYSNILNQHKRLFHNDKDVAFNLMKKLLKTHNDSDRYFVRTLNWAQKLFAKDQNYTDRFNALIADLATNSDSAGRFTDLFKNNIIEAAKTGNAENFVKFSKLANKVLKKESTGASHPFNEIKPFPGYFLSKKGVLQNSSTCRWDNVLNHYDVISNTLTGGSFHTDRDLDPHATVQLEGKGELSGITVVNTVWHNGRQLPLVVEVSEDGSTWKRVFRTEKNAKYWNINLQGKGIKATHVRVSSDKPKEQKEFFHLRGIFVYGRKLF